LIEHRGRFIRLTGLARRSDRALLGDFDKAAASFRALADWEAAEMKPYRLRAYEVRPGDTVDWLALASPSQDLGPSLFLTLNGLANRNQLIAGDMVKVVTE